MLIAYSQTFTSNFLQLSPISLQWHYNEQRGVSNHWQLHCWLNYIFRITSTESSKPVLRAICEGNHRWPVDSPHKGSVTLKEFPFHHVEWVEVDRETLCKWAIKTSRGRCNIGYPSETHLELKSRESSVAHEVLLDCEICANFQNDFKTAMDVLDERDFARLEFKMSFWQIPYISSASQGPDGTSKCLCLTHRGRVTHICLGKLAIIGSNNGLSPGGRQAIIWTNAVYCQL